MNWREVEYPCLGISDKGEIVCFSSYRIGHLTDIGKRNHPIGYFSNMWAINDFKPYTKPKEKTKLWYWEYKIIGDWDIHTNRLSEEQVNDFDNKTFRKLEALGFIYEDE